MKCPGQDTQFWNHSAVFEAPCPHCGQPVEFFKDDTTRKCRCGHRFVNPRMDFGCAAYCQYAEQCLGDLPPELVAQKEDLLKDRVAVAVKRHFKSDFRRIGRAARRARHAERLWQAGQGNLAAAIMAACLWEVDGQPPASELPVAQTILASLKAPEPLIRKVCAIVAGGGLAAEQDGIEQRVAADAARITDMEDRIKQGAAGEEIESLVRDLRTPDGPAYARQLFAVA